jgi:hypothetical protein
MAFSVDGPSVVRSDPAGRRRKSVGTGVGAAEEVLGTRTEQRHQERHGQGHDGHKQCVRDGRGTLIGMRPSQQCGRRSLHDKERARQQIDQFRSLSHPACNDLFFEHLASQGSAFRLSIERYDAERSIRTPTAPRTTATTATHTPALDSHGRASAWDSTHLSRRINLSGQMQPSRYRIAMELAPSLNSGVTIRLGTWRAGSPGQSTVTMEPSVMYGQAAAAPARGSSTHPRLWGSP